ncbi:MAG: FecR domain-containing protein [Pseudomonadota bacterium]
MTDCHDSREENRILDEASNWIARLDRGLSEDEYRDLRGFLEQEAAREHFLALAEHWDKLDTLSRLSDILPEVGRPRGPGRWQIAAATAALSGLVVSFFLFTAQVETGPPQASDRAGVVYETETGEQSSFKLPDGSAVALNTNSRLAVTFSDTGRLVVLQRGEAHFAVAKDAYRPFTVIAGDALIQALGTEFSVYISRPENVQLLVVEGAVRVAAKQAVVENEGRQKPPGLLSTGKTVSAGRIGHVGGAGVTVAELQPVEIEAMLSWRNGNLVFGGESLEEAITEISRYTNVEFVFLNEQTKQIAVAGLFRTGDVEGLLETLQVNFGIAYQRVGDDRVLLGSE